MGVDIERHIRPFKMQRNKKRWKMNKEKKKQETEERIVDKFGLVSYLI